MEPYQQDFIRFALESGALRFGRYTLKSGRVSPYFFNAGLFDTGRRIARLGRCYAAAIVHSGFDADMLFGPAYKGIPLVTAAAVALADHHARDLPYAFNRKEVKDHGEGGNVVGAPLAGRVLIVDDVITSGLSVEESVAIIRAAGAAPAGVVIALDRQERGRAGPSAVREVQARYDVLVASIVTLADLIAYLGDSAGDPGALAAIRRYRAEYGIGAGV